MEEIGVDSGGITLMAPKGCSRVLRLENLSPWQANLIKQEMLSLGGEAAVHRGAIDCSATETGALLMGTQKHFTALLGKLGAQPPSMRDIGSEIQEGIERFETRRFTIDLGSGKLVAGERTLVMGIVNVSPDSFYDGGRYDSSEKAVEQGLKLVDEGADILDIGGESTRPGADPVAPEEEKRRILPVIEALSSRCGVPLSVDTYKAEVAGEAIEAGARIVNDISGLRFDPAMASTVAEAEAALIVMHIQGEPRTMQSSPKYENLMGEIMGELDESLGRASEAGILPGRLMVDPGIGFGKKHEHNFQLLRRLGELRTFGVPIVVGPSRKSFIGAVSDVPPEKRLEGTIAASVMAAAAGAHIVRVHDAGPVRRALEVADAVCRSEG